MVHGPPQMLSQPRPQLAARVVRWGHWVLLLGLVAGLAPVRLAWGDIPPPPSPTACRGKQVGAPCTDPAYRIEGTCKRVSEGCFGTQGADGTCLLCADGEGRTAMEGGGRTALGPSRRFLLRRLLTPLLVVVVPVLLLAVVVTAVVVVLVHARRRRERRACAAAPEPSARPDGETPTPAPE